MDLILLPPPGPHVVTLHDVVAWEFSGESSPVRAATEELRAADSVVCVSQFTADEAARLLGVTTTVVVANGVGTAYFDAPRLASGALAGLSLARPTRLCAD